MTDTGNDRQYKPRSTLLEYLPAIYQEGENREARAKVDWQRAKTPEYNRPFLDDYLLPYEQLLLKGDGEQVGIEQLIERMPEVFDPLETDERLLSWLAKWAAFKVRGDVPTDRIRRILGQIIGLYRIRGTKEYIETLLELFVDAAATVIDGVPEFEIARHSTIGVNACLGGGAPYFFRVFLRFSASTAGRAEFQARLASEIIELAKPAHTTFELEVVLPRMQIAVRSTINQDTIL